MTAQQTHLVVPKDPLGNRESGSLTDLLNLSPILSSVGRRCWKTFTDPDGRIYRRCKVCKQIKPLDEFYAARSDRRFGKHCFCKPCARAVNKEKAARQKNYLKKYGMTAADLERMLVLPNGLCVVCQKPFKKTPHVDHCHETGKVRGLLCYKCNTLLGNAGDDPAVLKRAAEYLERTR